MKNLAIFVPQELNFPLAEGLRKQAWWTALAMKDRYNVTVYDVHSKLIKKERYVEGIKIIDLPKFFYNIKTDILHFFGCPNPDLYLLLKFSKFEKLFVSFFDGELCEFWKSSFSRFALKDLRKKVNKIFVQTKYQKNIAMKFFEGEKISLLLPLIKKMKKKAKKLKKPSMLFMSHLSDTKGINELLSAYYEIVKSGIPLNFVIADSKIKKKSEKINLFIKEINSNGGNIILKGVVDPEEELSKSSIYAYPIKSAHNTFSLPLSLIEAIQIGVPFISTDVGGLREMFGKKFLINEVTAENLKNKIIKIMKYKSKPNLKKKISNKKIIKELTRTYENY